MLKKSLFLSLFIFICLQGVTAQNTQQKRTKTKYVYISIHPGISLDHMDIKGYFNQHVKLNNPGSFYITGAADIDYDGEVIFRTALTYKTMHFHKEESGGENKIFNFFELKWFSMIPEFQLLLKKSINSNLNFYGGAGFGYRFSKVLKNEIKFAGNPPGGANSFTIETNDGVVSAAIGLIYDSRFEFNCKFSVTQWGNSSTKKLTNRCVNMGLCYRL